MSRDHPASPITDADRRAIRDAIRETFAAELTAVATAADRVARDWPESTDTETADAAGSDHRSTTDRTAAVDALADRLRATDTLTTLAEIPTIVADTLDTPLPATPVPEPPYLVVTADGPMARATLPDRTARVVVTIRVFHLDPTPNGPRYVRPLDSAPTVEISVEPTD